LPGLLTLLSIASALAVDGNTSCPSPTEVVEHLQSLLPEEFANPEYELHLSTEDGRLVLSLTTRAGGVLATRRLSLEGSCARMARQVAVIAAAWQAELSDEPLPPPPPIEPEEEVAAIQAPRPVPAPTVDLSRRGFVGLGFRALGGPKIAGMGFELEAGKSWGRWGIAGSLAGPLPWVRLGPTCTLVEGYPTVGLRAQGEFALLFRGPDWVGSAAGVELGVHTSLGRTGTRFFFDLAGGQLFYTATYGALTTGVTFGGPD
jgi:hypothetical protein